MQIVLCQGRDCHYYQGDECGPEAPCDYKFREEEAARRSEKKQKLWNLAATWGKMSRRVLSPSQVLLRDKKDADWELSLLALFFW